VETQDGLLLFRHIHFEERTRTRIKVAFGSGGRETGAGNHLARELICAVHRFPLLPGFRRTSGKAQI